MVYFLMHENAKLALFDYESRRIDAVVINNHAKNLLPFLKRSSKSLEYRLADWILNRGIPVTRQGIQKDLSALKEKSVVDYMISNLGLSLTDHYWICPKDSGYCWENVNLYENNFTYTYSLDLKDDLKSIAGKTSFVPSASLKGDLRKKWIIDKDGVRRLVKGNSNHTCRQSLCEVLAAEIHKRQGQFAYTPYRLIQISSDGQEIIGCDCPNFTDIHTEFISAIDIVNSIKKSNASNYYEEYIEYCGQHGMDRDSLRDFMEYQILTDFVITNTDRHLNNFGVIRDSKTLRFLKPAPIFDSGNGMFYNTGRIKTGYELLNIKVNSFRSFEVELLRYVSNPGAIDLSRLPSADEVYRLFQRDLTSTEDTIGKLVNAYQKKIEFLYELQHGVKIYSHDYLSKHNVKLDKRE